MNLNKHQIIEYAKNYNNYDTSALCIDADRLCLKKQSLYASYASNIIETSKFITLVGSWACITDNNSTCELMISVRVDNVWSEYVTYSPWGLGLQNKSFNQENELIKLVDDEIIVLNNKVADAIKYIVTLRKSNISTNSPKLLLVSFALEIANYEYFVNIEHLPKKAFHDVPKLCQLIVPEIGNSICSPTSVTMLLKYNGIDFGNIDDSFEHRYIAYLAKDYGYDIFGNWVYNTVTMGAFGFKAYVARMYSVEELIDHLAKIGPVALSVKGKMISSEKTYNTSGHLLVATGYEFIGDDCYILCNDPNVNEVFCKYSINVINSTWRKVCYVIEK